jgi:uncharacterized protein
MTDRSGIEVDYCPTCRGVWLDRGELDKIIERAAPAPAAQPMPQPAPAPADASRMPQPAPAYDDRGYDRRPPQPGYDSKYHQAGYSKYHDSGYSKYRTGPGGYPKRRKLILGEIFDF